MDRFFIDEFEIKKDIIYGRGYAINAYIQALQKKKKFNEDYSKEHNAYKNNGGKKDFFSWIKENHFFAINTYNRNLNDAEYVGTYENKFNKYNETLKKIDQTKFIKSNVSIKQFMDDKDVTEAAYKDMIIRRGCKFGIKYITENLSGKVYYALDGITSDSVTNKENFFNKSLRGKKLPICTTELRYLFRNWQHYKDKVIFMKITGDIPEDIRGWVGTPEAVKAPWEDSINLDGWASYALDRIAKEMFKPPINLSKKIGAADKLNSFVIMSTQEWFQETIIDPDVFTADKCKSMKTAAEVIQIFHRLPHTLSNKDENAGAS